MDPVAQYAKSGDVFIAYQIFGEGRVDLIMVLGFLSHIEHYWSKPRIARWLLQLGNIVGSYFSINAGPGCPTA